MTYEEWIETYRPIKNHLDPNATYDGFMFETFGDELNHIHSQHHLHVWTYVCEGDTGVIISGCHVVNRMGYFITEVPAPDEPIEIVLHEPRHKAEHQPGFGIAIIDTRQPARAIAFIDEGFLSANDIAEEIVSALNANGADFNLEHEDDGE